MTVSQIVNVIATASVGQVLDFNELRKHKEIFYDKDVYKGRVAYFKAKGMQGKVSIFISGKMISIGTRSEPQAFKELQIAEKFLTTNGLIKHNRLQPKTQNLVITSDFGKSIDFEELSEKIKIIYEPEQFPGAILRLVEPFKASILLFASGKIVVAGLKSSNEIEPTIQKLKQLIEAN